MALNAIFWVGSFLLWERLSASIIAAGKPLPQEKYHLLVQRTQPLNREP
jgi:hypothetical protein